MNYYAHARVAATLDSVDAGETLTMSGASSFVDPLPGAVGPPIPDALVDICTRAMAYSAADCLESGRWNAARWEQCREVFKTHVVED